jgi:hypothetical protein
MRTLREAIIAGDLPEFVCTFMERMYPDGHYPEVSMCSCTSHTDCCNVLGSSQAYLCSQWSAEALLKAVRLLVAVSKEYLSYRRYAGREFRFADFLDPVAGWSTVALKRFSCTSRKACVQDETVIWYLVLLQKVPGCQL